MNMQIVCRCGATLVVPVQYAGQTVQCSNCGQPLVVPNTVLASPPDAYPIYDQSNPLATTGFVLSLVSFCVIALAPVAMIVSFLGLRKKYNQGMAIAGLVIGAFQTVSLVIGLIWLFFLGGLAIWSTGKAVDMVGNVVDQATTFAYREQTKLTIATAAATIDQQTTATGILPDEDEGTERIKHHEDAWGNPLRYTINETQSITYSIESGGPDGEWDTTDDFGMSFPTLAPSDVSEALALLTNESEHRQKAGLEWLFQTQPTEADRGRVLDAIIRLLPHESLSDLNRRALGKWMNEQELPRLIAALKPSGNKVESAAVIDVLADLKSEEGLLLLLNHPDTKVRSETDRALRKLGTNDETIVRRCLADLDSYEWQRQALARLKSMPLDAEMKSEVAEGTFQALLNMRILSGNVRDAVKLALNCDPTVVDSELIGALVNFLGKPGVDSARAADMLAAIGPIAESRVAAALDTSNRSMQINACKVLEDIGTEESLPVLRELTDDRFAGRFAQAAIKSIEDAKREPVEPPESRPESD